jgi:hypothetical protein
MCSTGPDFLATMDTTRSAQARPSRRVGPAGPQPGASGAACGTALI